MKQHKYKETEIGKIPEGWEVKLISEVSEIILGGTPKTAIKEYWDGNIKWASARDVANCNSIYIHETERKITQKGIENSAAKILPKDTIVITSRGTIGKIALLPEQMSFNQTCYGLKVRKKVSSLYLYYELKNSITLFDSVSYGTVFDTITKRTFDELKISVPPLSEQKAIAKILSDLDAKIELNQQMNKILEEMAQAIFKHWFINFEFPNEEGKPYKSSVGKMVDSELGPIPKNWHIGRLSDIAEITMGMSPPGTTYNEVGDGMPFFQGIRDFSFRYPQERVYCTDPKRMAEKDDILLSVRAPVGALNCTLVKCIIGRGLASIREKNGRNSYIYYLLQNSINWWKNFNAEGTVFGAVNKDDVNNFQIAIAPHDLINQLDTFLMNIDERVKNNCIQNRSLCQIRDSLLPRLMSGKIRVNYNRTAPRG